MLKRLFWVPFLLLLDATAVHDILVGEPNPWMEWAVLGLSMLAFGLLILMLWRDWQRKSAHLSG